MLIVTFLSDGAADADDDAEADGLSAGEDDGEAFPFEFELPQPAATRDKPVASKIGAIAFLFTFTSPYLTMFAALCNRCHYFSTRP